MVSFAKIQFNPEEEDIFDDLIMSGKQFKILNSKMNSLFQIVADNEGKHYVTGTEMDYLMKAQESQLRNLIADIEQKQAELLAFHSKTYDYKIQSLHDNDKARHDIFMESLNETKEPLDVKVVELKSLMTKEIKKLKIIIIISFFKTKSMVLLVPSLV
ncbi:unnamed protein product [Lactuca saligna]|uniref:Uncharacterized protein n=1 Tax=Lactuca saligna TaxID=75948 RepID=A0AA35ZBP8_LACSI|nr:unnamed protein product [Lactuca saligna]